MSLPTLAIVVPCYRQGEYVDQCIQSLLSCSPQPTEIIASDNLCPDGSYKILQKYREKIRIVRPQYTLPATHHFNFLASLSTSKFTSIVCADDYVKPNFTKVLLDIALKYPQASIIRAGFHLVNNEGVITKTQKLLSAYLNSSQLFPLSINRNKSYPLNFIEATKGSTNPLIAWAFNTNLFRKIGFFDDETDICDWSAFLALSKLGSFATSNTPIAYYRSNYRNNSDLILERAVKQLQDSILIGNKYIFTEVNNLNKNNQRLAIKNYLKKFKSITKQYYLFLNLSGNNADKSLIESIDETLKQCKELLR